MPTLVPLHHSVNLNYHILFSINIMDRTQPIRYITKNIILEFQILFTFISAVLNGMLIYMINRIFIPLALFCFFGFLFCSTPTLADTEEEVTLAELTLSNSDTELLLFGVLQNGLRAEVTESLQSGISIDFSFFVELYKTTENWPRELVASLTFKHSINYDTLRDAYIVTVEEKDNRTTRFSSLPEAQAMLERLNAVQITELSQLIPEQRYEVRIRAELSQKTMPLGVNNLLPLIKKTDVKTKWQNIEFSY